MSDDGRQSGARTPETRALAWLLGGLALLALAVVALTPELLGDLSGLGSLALVVLAAGLPGLAIMLVLASRRRSSRAAPPPSPGPAGNGDAPPRPGA